MTKPVVVRAEYLVDVERYRVYLKPGNTYLVDGVEVKPHGDSWRDPAVGHEVDSLTRVLVGQQVVDRPGFYSFGEEKLNYDEYFQRLYDLKSRAFEENDDDDDEVVVVIDKEAYKEFQQLKDCWVWNPDSLKLTWVEPLFEVDLGRLSSGDPHVYSARSSTEKPYTWEYNQAGATADYVRACFAGLGMYYVEDAGIKAPEAGQWSNTGHSHLKYVRAFGKYLFANDDYLYDFLRCPRFYQGSLEDMLARSRADKRFIERVIICAYKEATGSRSIQKNEIAEVLKDLRAALLELNLVKTTRNSGSYLRLAKEKIRDRVTALEDVLVKEHLDARK